MRSQLLKRCSPIFEALEFMAVGPQQPYGLCRDMMGVWKPLGNPAVGGDENDRAFCFFSQPTFVVRSTATEAE